MSSTYRLICLAHYPALVLPVEYQDLHAAEAAGVRDTRSASEQTREVLAEHPGCDLVIGRWSGALIEFMCPGASHPATVHHGPSDWLDVKWVRLLSACLMSEDEPIRAQAQAIGQGCWPASRVTRLMALLKLEAGE